MHDGTEGLMGSEGFGEQALLLRQRIYLERNQQAVINNVKVNFTHFICLFYSSVCFNAFMSYVKHSESYWCLKYIKNIIWMRLQDVICAPIWGATD